MKPLSSFLRLALSVIAIGAALKGDRARRKAIWQGYRRGAAAKWLAGEDYEQLMSEPLGAARRRLNLTPPTAYDAIPVTAR